MGRLTPWLNHTISQTLWFPKAQTVAGSPSQSRLLSVVAGSLTFPGQASHRRLIKTLAIPPLGLRPRPSCLDSRRQRLHSLHVRSKPASRQIVPSLSYQRRCPLHHPRPGPRRDLDRATPLAPHRLPLPLFPSKWLWLKPASSLPMPPLSGSRPLRRKRRPRPRTPIGFACLPTLLSTSPESGGRGMHLPLGQWALRFST